MKVILLEDVKGRGKKDEIIEVNGGFGMHLIREKKAIEASKGGVKVLDKQKEAKAKENEIKKEEAIKNKATLERKPLTFTLKVGAGGKVFKSISQKQIIDKILADFDIKIDKKMVKTKESISALGTTNIDIELFKGVIATIKVVVKEQ
ncbi:MAG: 50S ribosomal protein L9 [Erysipelotrichales bacterium]